MDVDSTHTLYGPVDVALKVRSATFSPKVRRTFRLYLPLVFKAR